jgi:ABC-2 type transport system permease protein
VTPATPLLQVASLGRRAVVRTARQPANVVFPLVFPMLLLAVNTGGLKAETRLPGFPTNSFLAFALAVPFVQGALLATVNANVDFARDIQTGFLNRLALTPVRGLVLLVGQLGGLVTIALVQALFYLAVGLAFGVRLESGVGGAVLLLLLETVIAFSFAALGSWAALRTGSTEAVQGLFPAFFVFLFLSSMSIPRNLIEQDWFRWVATGNPVSYLIESVRALVIEGWNWEAIGLGFGVAGAMSAVGFALAARALVHRLERT